METKMDLMLGVFGTLVCRC